MLKNRIFATGMAIMMSATLIPAASAAAVPTDVDSNAPYEEVAVYEGKQLLTVAADLPEIPEGGDRNLSWCSY